MINDVEPHAAPTPPPAPAPAEPEPAPAPTLQLLASDDDLVCVDDLCLPGDVRATPEARP